MRRLLSARADLANAATLLKLVGSAEPGEFFLPGGAALGADRFAALSRLPPAGLRQQLSGFSAGGSGRPTRPAPWSDPPAPRAPGAGTGPGHAGRGRAARSPWPCRWPTCTTGSGGPAHPPGAAGAEYGLPADDLLDLLERELEPSRTSLHPPRTARPPGPTCAW